MTIYKLIRVLFKISFVALFTVGCGAALSKLETQGQNRPGKQQLKPQCPVGTVDNCWARSLHLISQCLPPSVEGELTDDRRFCRNSQGLMIHFANPYHLKSSSDEIDFEVYSNQRKCFRIEKKGSDLKIVDSVFGEISLRVSESDNGAISVSCLFDENILINPQTLSENCTSQTLKNFNDWPGAVFKSEEDQSARHFMFSFVGLGIGNAPIFKCIERR